MRCCRFVETICSPVFCTAKFKMEYKLIDNYYYHHYYHDICIKMVRTSITNYNTILLFSVHSELSYSTVDNYNFCYTILCDNVEVGESCSVYYIIIVVYKNLLRCIKFVFRLKNKIALRPTTERTAKYNKRRVLNET